MNEDFMINFGAALIRFPKITIYMDDGEIIRIGTFDLDKNVINPVQNGFYIERGASIVWYSYSHIKKIEAFGNEYQRKNTFNG